MSTRYTYDGAGNLATAIDAAGHTTAYGYDAAGHLTSTNGAGSVTLATYTYDPLDRLRLVDYGAGNRVRFRYVGLTTSAVQTIDDATGTVIRHIGTGWGGELLLDWTGTGQSIRIFGTNAHHDLTWTASSSGAVTGSVRYDPAGVALSVTGSMPDVRFQGSWADDVTKLAWVVTRWYAPAQGRFISEDSLLGEPRDPDSRHLYAYGAGDPVGRWDPDGRDGIINAIADWFRKLGGSYRAHQATVLYAASWLLATALPGDKVMADGLLASNRIPSSTMLGRRPDLRVDRGPAVYLWEVKPNQPRYHLEGPDQLAGYVRLAGRVAGRTGRHGWRIPTVNGLPTGFLGEYVNITYGPEDGMIYYVRVQRFPSPDVHIPGPLPVPARIPAWARRVNIGQVRGGYANLWRVLQLRSAGGIGKKLY